MNFFQAQQHARSSTKWLVLLFILAVVILILITDLLVMAFMGSLENQNLLDLQVWREQFDWPIFAGVSALVIAVVLLASLHKMVQLRHGGEAVANMMGATLIPANTQDLHEQRLLNVVEEMAIASGTPVPPVYLMANERGINAFAAGYKPGDAIIAVTHGTLHKLSREQLQGIIGHEFSHILNGDMRLNIHLISILHGILVIGIIGYYIMRISGNSSGYSSRSNKNSGGLIFLGIGLLIIGYSGTFFGNLIKAQVSRKREYLADASAVQFTRNPDGIADALKRIGGSHTGSILANPRASELSHAYFAQGMVTLFDSLMATHPPLDKRIKAIQPHWDGQYDYGELDTRPAAATVTAKAQPRKKQFKSVVAAIAAVQAINSIGQTSPEHLAKAQKIIDSIPDALLLSAHEPHGARAIIHLLVLDDNAQERQKQLRYLEQNTDADVQEEVQKLAKYQGAISPQNRLALVDIALSSLHQLSKEQYQLFSRNLKALIEMDQRIELFEWALQKIVFHHLDPVFNGTTQRPAKFMSMPEQKNACQLLFSLLLLSNKQAQINEQQVFNQAMDQMGLSGRSLLKKADLSLHRLNAALNSLNNLHPLKKPQVLKACAFCITADNLIQPLEAELFRAIAAILDCPMPPLIVDFEADE